MEEFEEEPETSDRLNKFLEMVEEFFDIAHASAMKLIENKVANGEVL